jgi:hypothetical protein
MLSFTNRWWLDLACAIRDGITVKKSDIRKSGAKEIPTIALLKGIERFDPDRGCLMWELEGSLDEMQQHLISEVGKRVRIIRGYKLRSSNAPEAGIRYDGL